MQINASLESNWSLSQFNKTNSRALEEPALTSALFLSPGPKNTENNTNFLTFPWGTVPSIKQTNRRQFIGSAGAGVLSLLCSRSSFAKKDTPSTEEFLFLEAEGFQDPGGWELDQQSMDQMGSPYLLAHGLGIPVRDAITDAVFPSAGTYRVWVRTKDWVAPWKATGTPGKFQVLINGTPLKETFVQNAML